MSGLSQFRAKQINDYYMNLKDYKEYVDKGTDEALRIMCEAETTRDLLAAYAHTSKEAYQVWVEADKDATKAEQTYNEWLKEQREVHDEYYELLDDIDRKMDAYDQRW
jgi:dsDNA-specific endonuclease/ATPase MutS2